MYIDSHLHICDPVNIDYSDVRRLYINSVIPEEFPFIDNISQHYSKVTPFYGVHPWFAARLQPDWFSMLEHYIFSNPAAGIGEIGMDKTHRAIDLKLQRDIFERQLDLAVAGNRPVCIHSTGCSGTVRDIICNAGIRNYFLLHSYSGSAQSAAEFLELGAYFSFSMRQLNTSDIKNILSAVPLERIMVETDIDNDSKKEYLVLLKETYEKMAGLLSISIEELQAELIRNEQTFTNRDTSGQ